MRAKTINEAIKHLAPRSEEDLNNTYSKLPIAEKFLKGLENNNEDLVKSAMNTGVKVIKDDELKQYFLRYIGNIFLKNKDISIILDAVCDTSPNGKIDPSDENDAYFLDFLNRHNIKYKLMDERYGTFKFRGKARDIIQMLIDPFDTGTEGWGKIEDLQFYLWEENKVKE